MEPAIVLAIAVLAPVTLAILALRFGADSRPALHSAEHGQAELGVSWYGATPETGAPRPRPVVMRVTTAERHPYPTLRLIDSARGIGSVAFSTDPNAKSLERRARELADEYWSESVWLTGLIAPTQLSAVVDRLEAERQQKLDSIRLLVASEPARAGQPVHQA